MRRTGKLYTLTLAAAVSSITANVLVIFWSDNTSAWHLWLDIVPQGFGMASFITSTLIVRRIAASGLFFPTDPAAGYDRRGDQGGYASRHRKCVDFLSYTIFCLSYDRRTVTYLFRTTGQVLGVSLSGAILQAVLLQKLRERIQGPGSAEVGFPPITIIYTPI